MTPISKQIYLLRKGCYNSVVTLPLRHSEDKKRRLAAHHDPGTFLLLLPPPGGFFFQGPPGCRDGILAMMVRNLSDGIPASKLHQTKVGAAFFGLIAKSPLHSCSHINPVFVFKDWYTKCTEKKEHCLVFGSISPPKTWPGPTSSSFQAERTRP